MALANANGMHSAQSVRRNETANVTAIQPAAVAGGLAGAMAGLVFLASWGVVALSMLVVLQVATDQGLPAVLAVLLAAPAVAVPMRATVDVVRKGTAEGALKAHLWVLNGSVGWAVVTLAAIWLAATAQQAFAGSPHGFLLAGLTLGFVPLFGMLVLFNRWLLGSR